MSNLLQRCALVALATALAAAPALAQQTPTANPAGAGAANAAESAGGEILVTAQRREQRLQDVPVAVSVVSGATLQATGIRTLQDLSTRLGNVRISNGTAVDQIYFRGVGSGQDPGFEQAVATFADGVYRSRSRATRAALFDVERVEFLKGPQTTFFGANAIAGAINITTRKPERTFGFDGRALYEFEDGEYNLEGGVTGPLGDTLSARAAVRVFGMNGFVDNGALGDGPRERNVQGRIALRWEPVEALRSDLRVDAGRFRAKRAFASEIVGCPPPAPFVFNPGSTCGRFIAFQGGNGVDDKLDYHSDAPSTFANFSFQEAAWTNALQIGRGTLTAITAYYRHRYAARSQNIPAQITGTVNGYDPIPAEIRERYHQVSQELRYQSDTGGVLEYMFGGYFSKDKLFGVSQAGFFNLPAAATAPPELGLPAAPPLTAYPPLRQRTRTASGFASITVRPVESLRINLGARFSSIHKEAHHAVIFGSSVNDTLESFVPYSAPVQAYFARVRGIDINDFTQPTRTDQDFMPSVGVQYDFTRELMIYATYSEGFKAGGYGQFTSAKANQFGPEHVKAYEAGLKGSVLDRAVNFNLAVFRNDYRDLQEGAILPAAGGGFTSAIANVAGARTQGVELGLRLRFSEAFSINADLAYLDAKYTNYTGASCTAQQAFLTPAGRPCIQDMSGKRRPYAPKYSGSVGASVVLPAGPNELRFDPLLYFSSAYFQNATADPLIRQRGYAKVDARLSYEPHGGSWEIALIGRNLTDFETAALRQPLAGSPGTILAIPERGRSIAIQLSVKR